MATLSPWPSDSMNQAEAAEDIEKHLWDSLERDGETRTLSGVYGAVSAALVERYAPSAPSIVKSLAVIRVCKWLKDQPGAAVQSEQIKVGDAGQDMAFLPSMVSPLRHSGAMAMLTQWKRRRLGVVS